MTAPIIVPDDDSTRHALDDAILRATGYRPIDPDIILRALRLHSDHHGVGAATIDALWQQLQACEADRDFDRTQHARALAETRAHADAMLRLYVRTAETHDLIATRVVEAYMARRKTARLADLVAGTGYERADR